MAKIIFSGGGTLGPVTPLLAVAEILRQARPDTKFVWIGTRSGPERELVEKSDIPFFTISTAKWRRYFSIWNFFDIFRFLAAFFHSLIVLWQEKPDLLISAGGFVSVPVHWSGALLGIPQWVHQQDAVPGLANKMMVPFADKITTALRASVPYFNPKKTEWIGNPVRALGGVNPSDAKNFFGFDASNPVIFAMGGGTGSARLNQMILEAIPAWPKNWQVIHLVGQRPKDLSMGAAKIFPNYHVFEFFTDEMRFAYAAADVVIARGGFGTITELAALSKSAVLLPMAGTHQEANVNFLVSQNAVLSLDERTESGLKLAQVVKTMIESSETRARLGVRLHEVLPPAQPEQIVGIVDKLVEKK